MKHIWGILIIISFAMLLFTGISGVNNVILARNGANLDTQSIDLIAKYDTGITNLSDFQDGSMDTSLSSNSTNDISAEFREYAENKNNMIKFVDGITFLYKLPDIIFLSIVVVDLTDTSLSIYRNTIWFLITAVIVMVSYKFIRTGKTDDE